MQGERRLGTTAINNVSIQVSADKFAGTKMNVWNKMNGITVITERNILLTALQL
jgi:hypothetical protein